MNLTGGNAGGNTGIASFTHTLSGNSTYKWKWIPRDMNNDLQPDYQHFPADPLYILSKLSLGVQAWPSQFPPVGLEAIGGVANGAGWSRNFTGIPGMAPMDGDFSPPRVVVTDYLNPIATLILSPSANVGISGTQAGAPGSTSIFIGQTNFPVLLSQPDIFGRPDLGDGRNQFAFGTEQPHGRLYIPTSTSTSGAAAEDSVWLVPQVDWYYQPIVGSVVLPFTKVPAAGALYPRTEVDGVNYDSRIYFSPLPSAWNAFGNHDMILQINLQDSMRAKTQIFFNPTATNHPNPDETPNWWYYYKQAFQPPYNTQYEAGDGADGTYYPSTDSIVIRNGAINYDETLLFRKSTVSGFLYREGHLIHKGILNYIETCAHEAGHRLAFQRGACGTAPDADGDGVNDNWELRNNLDPNDYDTTHAYPTVPNGDQECIADIEAAGVLKLNKAKWKEDWSGEGLQWGNWGPFNPEYAEHYGLYNPGPPYHPWEYTRGDGAKFPDPPWASLITSINQLDGGGF